MGGEHIDPDYLVNSRIENIPPDEVGIDHNEYNGDVWPNNQDITNIYSPRGYSLTLNYTNQEGIEPHLYLEGNIHSATATTALFAEEKENWTGYWLYPTQDIFDALGDAIDDIYEIHHQKWYCKKGIAPFDPQAQDETQTDWYCDKRTHNIRYGEMVILKSSETINNFRWNIGGFPAAYDDPGQNPAYFTYEEQATYTPLMVELDSADQPLEIGAMINDTCIGATVVNPGDSIVVIRAYMENSTGDSVTFEMYYGTKSTASNRISSYSVWDRQLNAFTKRALRANEKEDYFYISLKKQNGKELKNNLSSVFSIWPNPSSGTLFYNIVLEEGARVTISLFDIAGKLLTRPLDEPFSSGNLSGELPLSDKTGRKLAAGIYFVQFKAGELIETKKVIVK